MKPVIKVASLDGDAPAAVEPWPSVLRVATVNVAKAGAEAYDMLYIWGESIAVYETSDLKGKVEEGGLELRIGRIL